MEDDCTDNKEMKYQELLKVENAVIFQIDREGRFSFLNSEWIHLTSYSIDESLGVHYLDYVAEEDQPFFEELIADLLASRRDGMHREITLISKDGAAKAVHLFMKADVDSQQQVRSVSGTFTDLASRRAHIQAYLENERNYRLISENTTDMIAVLSEDGLSLFASPSHAAVLGRTIDDYIGSFPIQYIHPDDWEKVFQFFQEMLAQWKEHAVVYRFMHADGHWIYLEMKGKPIKGTDGKTQVITVSRDITIRYKAEEELRLTSIKLKTLIASLPFGIKVEDEHGQPILQNDAYTDIFSSEDPVNMDEKSSITQCRRTSQGEELFLSNGKIIERDAIPLMDHHRFDGYLWIYRDVTKNKESERHLREANKLLQQLSMLDGLTCIANRRSFDEALKREWARQTQLSGTISLLLLDIDFFKDFNDLYGHQAGDACLKHVGNVFKQLPLGEDDLAARYGGEEFAVLLSGKQANKAVDIAKHIMLLTEELHIPHKGSKAKEFLSVSIGISTKIATKFSDSTMLLTEADKALYEAKRMGRNQFRVYDQV
jgi:diguanylate cyclase (GGDEF)-like protein/PAS domain S-box-containing protein